MSDIDEVKKTADKALSMAFKADTKIDSHNDLCALRYKNIQQSMANMKEEMNVLFTRMWVFAGSIIGGMFAIIMVLLFKKGA